MRAEGAAVGRAEAVVGDVFPGEVVDREVTLLEQDPCIERVDHGRAAQVGAHAPPDRLKGDVVVDGSGPGTVNLDGVNGFSGDRGHRLAYSRG